jgi:hypothetical protein
VVDPALFNLFVNDIAKVVRYIELFMFADDIKGLAKVNTLNDAKCVQEDLNALGEWSAENKLPFSINKCCMLHYGLRNPNSSYCINKIILHEVDEHDDLGVLRCADFSYTKHVKRTSAKVFRLCGMYCRVFTSRSREFMMRLWKTYLRPKLEYASQVWHDSYGCYKLERIQRKFTKRISGLSTLVYEDRLSELNLPSLKNRRCFLDLIFTHKLLNGQFNVTSGDLHVSHVQSNTRSNGVNMAIKRAISAAVGKKL